MKDTVRELVHHFTHTQNEGLEFCKSARYKIGFAVDSAVESGELPDVQDRYRLTRYQNKKPPRDDPAGAIHT